MDGRWDEIVAANRAYARDAGLGELPLAPRRRLAVVACMDARMDLFRALGLSPGDAHVIRTAGALVTDDVVRSLVVSHHLAGTDAVLVIAHTGCGLLGLDEEEAAARIAAAAGVAPAFGLGSFGDLEESVRAQVERVRAEPLLAGLGSVGGAVFDVRTGLLSLVTGAARG